MSRSPDGHLAQDSFITCCHIRRLCRKLLARRSNRTCARFASSVGFDILTVTCLKPDYRPFTSTDNSPDVVGIEPPPDRPYAPSLSDPKLNPMERYVAFSTWISGYYEHPGLETQDENGFSDIPLDDPPSTLLTIPHDILAQISYPKPMLRWETGQNLQAASWMLERTKLMLHKDTADYWPRCRVVVMWCEQSTWSLVRGAWHFKKLREEMETAGVAGRAFEWSSVPRANHFVRCHYCARSLRSFADTRERSFGITQN